jgi:hypothetical protein
MCELGLLDELYPAGDDEPNNGMRIEVLQANAVLTIVCLSQSQ